jgi:hypothetical protein
MGKKSGSGMNNPDHISESLKTIFWVKILQFFADPGSWMEKIRIRDPEWKNSDPTSGKKNFGSCIRDKHPGSATLILCSKFDYLFYNEHRYKYFNLLPLL